MQLVGGSVLFIKSHGYSAVFISEEQQNIFKGEEGIHNSGLLPGLANLTVFFHDWFTKNFALMSMFGALDILLPAVEIASISQGRQHCTGFNGLTALQRVKYRKRWMVGILLLWRYLSFIFAALFPAQYWMEIQNQGLQGENPQQLFTDIISVWRKFLGHVNNFFCLMKPNIHFLFSFSVFGLLCPELFLRQRAWKDYNVKVSAALAHLWSF